VLNLKNIHFSYTKEPFIDDLNLSFKQGEMVSVLGPNGSGKSTVVKILTGELKAGHGHVLLEDRKIGSIPIRELATRMAVMTQNARVQFPYTCLEVVQMGLYPHKDLGVGTDSEEIEALYKLMESTETDQFAEKLITEVSGGEAQRVLLTRILAQDTPLIVLDEAFSAMDVAHRVELLSMMKSKVHSQQKTVVAVMHDLNMAYMYSDRVVLMKNGQVVADGETDAVMTPENLLKVFGIHVTKFDGKGFIINPR
jgi:iron complex transport system ATP-binding protein